MKVINCCYDDYANYSFDNACALKSAGVDAESFNTINNLFGYQNRAKTLTKDQMKDQMMQADVIQIMHSSLLMLDYVKELMSNKNTAEKMSKKKIVVYHTGTVYRNEPEKYNEIFNPVVYRAITDQCEFMNLGAKDLAYLATAVDTNKIKPSEYKKDKLPIIGHYPSNSSVKGTQMIRAMLKNNVPWMYKVKIDEGRRSHKDQLARMNQCDIYIEMYSPTLNGKPYGCFGVTAFEAAALGKIVITNNIYEQVYEDTYGDCALIIANTQEKFISTIKFLISLSPEQIEAMQRESRAWVEQKHSYAVTGERIKQLIGI